MPEITNDPNTIRFLLQQSMRSGSFSQETAAQLLAAVRQDGVTRAEVNEIVETLTHAVAAGNDTLDLSSSTTTAVINQLLGDLKGVGPLKLVPPSRPAGSTDPGSSTGAGTSAGTGAGAANPGGTGASAGGATGPSPGGGGTAANSDYVTALRQRAATPAAPLAVHAWSAQSVGLTEAGDLAVGDRLPVLDLEGPTDSLLAGLWSLSRRGLDPKTAVTAKRALVRRLVDEIARVSSSASTTTGLGQYRRQQALTAAVAAVAALRDSWPPSVADSLLPVAKELRLPLARAILVRALNAQTDAPQTEAPDGLKISADEAAVMQVADDVIAGQARVGNTTLSGAAAQAALAALCFAKSGTAAGHVFATLDAWKKLGPGPNTRWTPEAIRSFYADLEVYVEGNGQSAYTFGLLRQNTPKTVGAMSSARAVAPLQASLRANSPNLQGYPLTPEQAERIRPYLPLIRDEAAIDQLVRSLATAAAIFEKELPSPWRKPALPAAPMPPAAFSLFARSLEAYAATVSQSMDAKLGFADFFQSLRDTAKPLHGALAPYIAGLESSTPTWGNVEVSEATASLLRDTLQTRIRSVMSLHNLQRAVAVVANSHAGQIKGQAATQLRRVITDYCAMWPAEHPLDFNKLERFATYEVQNKDVPLCTLNGKEINLATFYDQTALAVSHAIDPKLLRRPWMAQRWGMRAREALELLDVVAEQSLRAEGPVAALRQQFPGHDIVVEYTGLDGDHEQLIYRVVQGNKVIGRFNQGSNGGVSQYTASKVDPLFTAAVGADGSLDVQVPNRIRVRRYPLQHSYGVGDPIDFPWLDPMAKEEQKAGELFSTKSRVVEGEILSYNAAGKYEIAYHTPSGKKETATVSLSEIRRANNPHWFKPTGDDFREVTINLDKDEALRAFVDDAKRIIARHLPQNDSLVTMSTAELARRQKACIKDLIAYTEDRVQYPDDADESADDNSKLYHEKQEKWTRFPLGDLVKIGRGVCRHQCILEHILLQEAGIDSRLASGAANTRDGKFRGYHIWCEVTLANGERFLSDQTWGDAIIPLWSGAYSVDKRRVEMYRRTAYFDGNVVLRRAIRDGSKRRVA